MWNKMTEGWLWGVALVDMALAFGLAHLFVRAFGWRWSYLAEAPLDASTSILGFAVVLGMLLPICALFGGAILQAELESFRAAATR